LQLLIVPLAIAAIGFLFAMQQDARQQQIENQRAQAERELAKQRAQDEALQSYLDQMNNLLLEHNLRSSEGDSEVRTLARARTLTVLGRLDPSRKTSVMQFLQESGLIQGVDEGGPIIRLDSADLSGTDLGGADLTGADLIATDLSNAVLIEVEGVSNEQLKKQTISLEGALMPSGQPYELWLKSREGDGER
jgi:hypothetical protein